MLFVAVKDDFGGEYAFIDGTSENSCSSPSHTGESGVHNDDAEGEDACAPGDNAARCTGIDGSTVLLTRVNIRQTSALLKSFCLHAPPSSSKKSACILDVNICILAIAAPLKKGVYAEADLTTNPAQCNFHTLQR
jgi:hypothetical protein